MSLRACSIIVIVAVCAYSQTSDVTPPTLLSFSFSPTSIDTRAGPQNITFTADASDDLSGVSSLIVIELAGPNDQTQGVILLRTSGTAALGTYSATYSFPQFMAAGAWRVDGSNV